MADYLSPEVQIDIDMSYLLDMYVHFDCQKPEFEGKSLKYILDHLDKDAIDSNDNLYKYLKDAVGENPDLANCRLMSQSNCDGFSMNEVISCAFKAPDGKVYVCYRGTGDGKWPDNAEAMFQKSSVMQETAANYFDYVANNYVKDGSEIVVCGHSKGGNLAQYVTMAADNRERISACYSMDGQGFSHEGIQYFKEINGNSYEAQRDKVYSICGENDFVNVLGKERLVKDNHRYIVPTPRAEEFEDYHHMYFIGTDIKNNDGRYGINWLYRDGEVVSGEPGEVTLFAERLNDMLNKSLTPEEYEDVTFVTMSLLEATMKDKEKNGGIYLSGTGNDRKMAPEEIASFIVHGCPLVIKTLLTTKEGLDLLSDYVPPKLLELIKLYTYNASEKSGASGVIGAVGAISSIFIGVGVITPDIISVCKIPWVVAKLRDYIDEKFPFLSECMHELASNILEAAIDVLENIKDWYDNHLNAGYIYAGNNPYICVDTDKLGEYAAWLDKLIEMIKKQDNELDKLYRYVKLTDLGKVQDANLLVGGTSRLKRCSKYLRNTKEDFEAAERDIKNSMRY